MNTREICKLCYHINPIGFHVPDNIWLSVVPLEYKNKVICLNCFIRLADEKLIEWDRKIELFPVSLITLHNLKG